VNQDPYYLGQKDSPRSVYISDVGLQIVHKFAGRVSSNLAAAAAEFICHEKI